MSPPPRSDPAAYGYHPQSVPPSYRGPPYPPYFPMASPPQPYLPGGAFEYPPRTHYRPMTYPPPSRSIPPYHQHPGPQHYLRFSAQQYHHHHHQQQHGYPPGMYPPPPQQRPPPVDMFAPFMEAGDPRQHGGGPAFGPIDWPIHAPVQDGRPELGM